MDDKHSETEARLAALEAKVAYLSDRLAISDVHHRYIRGFDRNDVDLLRSAVWPDYQNKQLTRVRTIDEFVDEDLGRHLDQLASWGHLITNESVEIDGDVAHVETYCTALFVPKEGGGPFGERPWIVGVRLVDRLDRRNGEWRLSLREVVPHFSDRLAEDAWRGEWPESRWSRDDVSYRRPLERWSTP
jgi:hypothetical protein